MAGWDWYATVAALAGVHPTDHKAAQAGLPAIESYNLWPLISGQIQTSPRTEVALGAPGKKKKNTKQTVVGGLIRADSDGCYKVVIGEYKYAGWTGPTFPNSSFHVNMGKITETCGDDANNGCLYNIMDDPNEHVNLAKQQPTLFKKMMARVTDIQKNAYSPDRGDDENDACKVALKKYGGFWGPWIDVDMTSSEQRFVV